MIDTIDLRTERTKFYIVSKFKYILKKKILKISQLQKSAKRQR